MDGGGSGTDGDGPGRRAPRVVGEELLDRTDAIGSVLLDPAAFGDERPAEAAWLRDRYRELVPELLPAALRAVVTGTHLDAGALRLVRASAVRAQQAPVPFRAAIRGGVPALRTFGALVQALDRPLSAADTTILMGRAALVAQELAATWHDAWRSVTPDPTEDGLVLGVTVEDPDDDTTPTRSERTMIALTAEGRSTDEVAAATAYSVQAVKWHLRRVMRAWNAPNRAALVAVALARGVVTGNLRRRDCDGDQLALPDRPGQDAATSATGERSDR